jgi:hypothetical protein
MHFRCYHSLSQRERYRKMSGKVQQVEKVRGICSRQPRSFGNLSPKLKGEGEVSSVPKHNPLRTSETVVTLPQRLLLSAWNVFRSCHLRWTFFSTTDSQGIPPSKFLTTMRPTLKFLCASHGMRSPIPQVSEGSSGSFPTNTRCRMLPDPPRERRTAVQRFSIRRLSHSEDLRGRAGHTKRLQLQCKDV